jgi:3-(3-hydroxy-phenyl)propionate hydroxylase
MKKVDVVILGGGPVGSFLATILNDMGVSNVVIDRDLIPYQLPRAIVMDDEILRACYDHGMGEWLQLHTEPLQRGDFVGPDDEVIIGADIPPIGLQGVPPVVVHYQPELDAMLRAEAERRGSSVMWGRTVTHMEDDGKKVVTTLDNGETIESRWFVGCDGASSWTRKFLGLQLEDLRFDQEWLVVDAELHEGAAVDLPTGVRQFCHTDRPFTFVQGVRRYRRWEFQVQDGEDAGALNTESGLWELLDGMISPSTARIVRSAVYRFHAVVAPVMQQGNVFLAGDSAHQTPPFAGQGLNSGMRDALNLAWKLSMVKRKILNESVLDTYTEEREPHVRSTIAHAVDMGRLIDQVAGRVSHGVDVESGYGGTRPAPHIESGVVTGDDPRVGHQFWFAPEVSEALRTHGASFVVVSAQRIELPEPLRRLTAINVVSPQAVGDSYAIVIRPDRYVALVAASEEDLSEKTQLFTPLLAID